MTNSFVQIAPTVAVRYCSIFRRVPSRHFLCPPPYGAHREAPAGRLPKNLYNSDQLGTFLVSSPIAFDNWRRYGRQSRRQRPVESADTRQSKSSVCWLFSGQMTIIHPILESFVALPAVLAHAGWRSRAAAFRLFFQPRANRIASNAKGARQSAQRRAFFVGTQDFLALFWRIAGRLRIITAATPTIFAVIALFAIAGPAVAKQVVTAAMTTGYQSFYHHMRVPFLTLLSHYRFSFVASVVLGTNQIMRIFGSLV